jgi:hypothetical protein
MSVPSARAQGPWQYRWQKGQVLSYRVEHATTVTEVIDGGKQQFRSRLDLLKRYRVTEVDAAGVATVEVSVASMRNEQARPNGEVLFFDSSDPAKSTPELREQMTKYVGTTLAVLRVDAAGRVVEVKRAAAGRYDSEPPFALVLPGTPVQPGQSWLRDFEITLEPPAGTGEKYRAQQKFQCTKLVDGKATVALTTGFQTMPESAQEKLPLMQKAVEGEIVFDVAAGRVAAVQLRVNRVVENHQGVGSSYHFQSEYFERQVSE